MMTADTPATLNLADKLAQFADHWNPRMASRRHMRADTKAILAAHDIVFGACNR